MNLKYLTIIRKLDRIFDNNIRLILYYKIIIIKILLYLIQ